MRRKLEEKSIRKVYKKSGSYAITIPIEIIREMGIREGQKLVIKKKASKIIISDWKK